LVENSKQNFFPLLPLSFIHKCLVNNHLCSMIYLLFGLWHPVYQKGHFLPISIRLCIIKCIMFIMNATTSITHTNTYLYAKFSACFLDPMSCTMAKNCWCPSNFSCFSSTNIKWWPKHDCIMTQSTAPGRLISVAKNTISSPAITKNMGN